MEGCVLNPQQFKLILFFFQFSMALIGHSTSICWLHAAAIGLHCVDSAESASNHCPLLNSDHLLIFSFCLGMQFCTMVGYFICLFLMKKGNTEGKLKQLQSLK